MIIKSDQWGIVIMIVQVPTEIIPIWYIEKWERENSEPNSPLDHFLKQMINDWNVEEKRMEVASLR
jgi:hypothetical protein